MPFQSESQRRYMWAKHPAIAKRWAAEYPNQKDLPYRKLKKKRKDRLREHGERLLKRHG